jgi:CheY-like chemotaxis protein
VGSGGGRAAADARADGPVVLVVEDDSDLLQIAEMLLEGRGCRAVGAENGRRALNLLEVVEPDVIVTDLMMPELDGFGFMREYFKRPPPHAPIVAMSAFGAYLDEARELGAAATIEKPFESSELTSIVIDLARGRTPAATAERRAGEDERARLKAVLDLEIERPDPTLQPLVDDLAAIFEVPVAGLSAVTENWQRLAIRCSTAPDDPGGPRESSFCTHAVAARAALIIQDALENPLFRDNPSVTERGFRFYAGVPLIAAHGEAVGTLCLLDFQPHSFTYLDLELLGLISRRVLAALDHRHKRERPEIPDSAYGNLQAADETLGIYGRSLFQDLVVVWTSRCLQLREPGALVAVAVPDGRLESTARTLREVMSGGLIGRLGLARLGVLVHKLTADEAQEAVRRAAGDDAVVVATDLAPYQGAAALALRHVEQALGGAGL